MKQHEKGRAALILVFNFSLKCYKISKHEEALGEHGRVNLPWWFGKDKDSSNLQVVQDCLSGSFCVSQPDVTLLTMKAGHNFIES